MSPSHSDGPRRFFNLARLNVPNRRPSRSSLQPLASNPSSPIRHRTFRSSSSTYSDPFQSSSSNSHSNHHGSSNGGGHSPNMDDVNNFGLAPPTLPFRDSPRHEGSGLSSRRSSFASDKGSPGMGKTRPSSLSVNYVPAKFTKLHAPGDWAHRRAKVGGGRDAFARNASRMGMIGNVDDDEGVVFQLSKNGLKQKKPKLRWNRFKFVLFFANTVVRPSANRETKA